MTQEQVNKLTQKERERLIKQLFKVHRTVSFTIASRTYEFKSKSIDVSCGQMSTGIYPKP